MSKHRPLTGLEGIEDAHIEEFPQGSAWLSEDLYHRFELRRTWDEDLPRATWVMLNPSTADADEDDPTIRKVVGFSRRWGCGSIVVVNLFTMRATDPRELEQAAFKAWEVNRMPEADEVIISAFDHAARLGGPVVFAWGVKGSLLMRDDGVANVAYQAGLKPKCLGRTKGGHPRHPVRLSYSTELVDYFA